MKELYSFPVKVDDADTTVFVAKPSNSDVEDAEYIYGQKFSHLLNDGFLSKAMMNKKFGDIGGIYSEKTNKELGEAIFEMLEAQKVIEFYAGAGDLTEEQSDKLKNAEATYLTIQKLIVENDSNLKQMFSQSADAKAEEYMIKWFVLNTAYYYEEVSSENSKKREAFKIFDKPNFTEKKEQLNLFLEDISEEDSKEVKRKKQLTKAAIPVITRVITLWYNGLGDDQKSIEDALAKYFKVEPEEKPKKKKVKAKTD